MNRAGFGLVAQLCTMLSNRAAAVVLLPSSCVAAVVVLLFAVAQAAAPVAGNQRPRWVYESMTVQPVFSPDNSVKEIVTLINSATTTLDVQNQVGCGPFGCCSRTHPDNPTT